MIVVGPTMAAFGVAINVWAYLLYGSAINVAAGVFCFLCFLFCAALAVRSTR